MSSIGNTQLYTCPFIIFIITIQNMFGSLFDFTSFQNYKTTENVRYKLGNMNT